MMAGGSWRCGRSPLALSRARRVSSWDLGAGKSTLLHLMGGLERPERGRVLFDGSEPRSPSEWARLRATRMGFVFQAYHLLPTLTALENIEIPMMGVVASAGERRRRAMQK